MVTMPAATPATRLKPTTPKHARRRLKVGDKVCLKSGGSDMCVTAIRQDGSIRCAWFGNTEKVHRAAFPEAALEFQPDEIWDAKLRAFVTVDDADEN